MNIKKIISAISASALLLTAASNTISAFAEENSTTDGTGSTIETVVNEYGFPLMPDELHGSTMFEDIEYVGYSWADIQDTFDSYTSMADLEFNDENSEKVDSLATELMLFLNKVINDCTIIMAKYYENPTEATYNMMTASLMFEAEFENEYNSTYYNIMTGTFGTGMLAELKTLSETDESYVEIYETYLSMIEELKLTSSEEVQALSLKIAEKNNEYLLASQAALPEEVEYNGETISYDALVNEYELKYSQLISTYSDITEIPENELNDFYSIESAVAKARESVGCGTSQLEQIYIDIVKLYDEYAKALGYDSYIDYAYSYDTTEIAQISQSIKDKIVPMLSDYAAKFSSNPVFNQLKNTVVPADEAENLCRTVISSVSEKYTDIFNYMTDHNLLILDDDYNVAMGYTTPLPSYSSAYIYLTFDEDNIYNNLTNGIAHEFGHYIDWYTNLESFATSSMATAENVSVTFSQLFTDNFDAYYDEETSDVLKAYNVICNISNYVSNTMSNNDFELYAFENVDTLTPESLEEKYNTALMDYNIISKIEYQLGGQKELGAFTLSSQFYQQPFYMVDYGLAGLAAYDIMNVYAEDKQAGLDLFDKLYTNELYLSDYVTMMKESLGIDIYSDSYVSDIADGISAYLSDKLESIDFVIGDVNKDGSINAVDASMVLTAYANISTGAESGFTKAKTFSADVTGDGNINAVDSSNILSYYAYTSTGGTNSLSDFLAG